MVIAIDVDSGDYAVAGAALAAADASAGSGARTPDVWVDAGGVSARCGTFGGSSLRGGSGDRGLRECQSTKLSCTLCPSRAKEGQSAGSRTRCDRHWLQRLPDPAGCAGRGPGVAGTWFSSQRHPMADDTEVETFNGYTDATVLWDSMPAKRGGRRGGTSSTCRYAAPGRARPERPGPGRRTCRHPGRRVAVAILYRKPPGRVATARKPVSPR